MPRPAARCGKGGRIPQLRSVTPFLLQAPGAPPRSTIQLPRDRRRQWAARRRTEPGMVYVNAQDTSLVGWVSARKRRKLQLRRNSSDQPYDRASVDGKGPSFRSVPASGQYEANGARRDRRRMLQAAVGRVVRSTRNTGAISGRCARRDDELPKASAWSKSGSAAPRNRRWVVFVGATNDRRFRAFDSATDAVVGDPLRANANANR